MTAPFPSRRRAPAAQPPAPARGGGCRRSEPRARMKSCRQPSANDPSNAAKATNFPQRARSPAPTGPSLLAAQGENHRGCLTYGVDMDPSSQTPLGRKERERALAELATRQHGVASCRQLRAMGFGEEAIK